MDAIAETKQFERDLLRPFLKKQGFSKKGNYYVKPYDSYDLVLQFQKSDHNTRSSSKFTFNIGIEIHDYFQVIRDRPSFAYPCFWLLSERIGHFLKNPRDKWYTFGQGFMFWRTDEKTLQALPVAPASSKEIMEELSKDLQQVFDTFDAHSLNLLLENRYKHSKTIPTYRYLFYSNLAIGNKKNAERILNELLDIFKQEETDPDHQTELRDFHDKYRREFAGALAELE